MSLSPNIATSINIHDPFSFSLIIFSGFLLVTVLSLCTFLFHTLFTLFSLFLSTNFDAVSNWISDLNCTSDLFCILFCSKRTFYLFSACEILLSVLCMLILCVALSRKIFVYVQPLQWHTFCNVCVSKYCFCNA